MLNTHLFRWEAQLGVELNSRGTINAMRSHERVWMIRKSPQSKQIKVLFEVYREREDEKKEINEYLHH